MTCVAVYRDPASLYPVFDPRRASGRGPFQYAYVFTWDGVVITVDRFPTPALGACSMRVHLTTRLREAKEIQAWNLYSNTFNDQIGTAGGQQLSMTIRKPTTFSHCSEGADTLVLARHFAPPRGRTALYSFIPDDFWDFWGGCEVTFDWQIDNFSPAGNWGNQTPSPTYPTVPFPDGTVMRMETSLPSGPRFFVVVGGAAFAVTDALDLAILDTSQTVPFVDIGSVPVDGTLLREPNGASYICYGGAKFLLPVNGRQLTALGITAGPSVMIPRGSLSSVGSMPMNGTLLSEVFDRNHIFMVSNGSLHLVPSDNDMRAMCLARRHVRLVPSGALAALPHGPDLP